MRGGGGSEEGAKGRERERTIGSDRSVVNIAYKRLPCSKKDDHTYSQNNDNLYPKTSVRETDSHVLCLFLFDSDTMKDE